MKCFGPRPWGPGGSDYIGPLRTLGRPCLHCDEPVTADDSGIVTSLLTADGGELALEHRECLFRQIFGSVGHQRGLCSCDGGPGSMDDPPGMTKREAARAAVSEFERTTGRRLV